MKDNAPSERAVSAALPAAAKPENSDAQRKRVADGLEACAAKGGILDPWGPYASFNDGRMFIPRTSPGTPLVPLPPRLAIYREIDDPPPIALPSNPPAGMVLFTAGAPGAGKSTRLNELGLLGGCRVIDPDAYKERLIARLTELDDPWLMRATRKVEAVLGLKVAPLEMAAVVHEESLYLAEIAFREALRTSEQVCFAGTCSNEAFVRRLLRLVRAAGREECCVLLVEVPEHVALHRAERRWWEGRQAFEQGDNALGARYLPTAVISSSFAEGTSVAARTVERIRAIPEAGIRLVIYDG